MANAIGSTKFCPKCKQRKELSEFGKSRDRHDGVQGACRLCINAARKAGWAKLTQDQKDVLTQKAAEWRSKNPGKHAEYAREARQRRPEAIAEQGRASRKRHAAEIKIKMALWQKKNPDIVRAHQNAARARKNLAAGNYTPEDMHDIRQMQKDRCAYCRCKLKGKGEIDHIIPLIKRGSNDRRNLQLTCRSCNASKHAKDPIDFANRIGRLI
jgi:hypothetical protein